MPKIPHRLLKECMQSVLYDNHSFCWTFGIVHRSHAKDFPRGYLGWQEPGHTNVKPFPWKCPHAKYKCIQWDGYGWTGYRPSRWGQRFDEEEEALARLPANLRPQFPKDRTGTYEYQAEKEQSIRLELDSLEKK